MDMARFLIKSPVGFKCSETHSKLTISNVGHKVNLRRAATFVNDWKTFILIGACGPLERYSTSIVQLLRTVGLVQTSQLL